MKRHQFGSPLRSIFQRLAQRWNSWRLRKLGQLQGVAPGKYRTFLWAALTFSLLSTTTVWLWRSASIEVTQVARERFDFKVTEVEIAIQQRLLAYEQVLRGGAGLFAASDDVTREKWRSYVSTLLIDKNYPGIQGIGFSLRILPKQREAHTKGIRSEGFPEYEIRPPGERAEYTAIIYLEPFNWRNQRAFGYDMFSEEVRREAMERARDTGLPSVSGKVRLVQETSQATQRGFLMYVPVFQKRVSLQTVEERKAALVGYVYSPFRMRDLLQGTLGSEALPNIRLEIFDGAATPPESLLYDSQETSSETRRAVPAFSIRQVFEFNGRTWTLVFSSLPVFDATIDVQRPRLILFGGLLISGLIAAVVWSFLVNRSRARELAGSNAGLQAEIAERTKLEAALKMAKDAAEAANQAKSEFLASVSHELRTPLTLILAPLGQLLVARQPLVDWRSQLERVQRNALLLLNRVNDILDFSKAEAGKFEVCCEPVDLVELVSALAGDAAVVTEDKGCSFTWHVDAALDEVCLDRRHFEKIFLNLVSNALKFTPTGGAIRLEAAALDDQWFEFTVADTGIGIPSDKLPLLFKRFQQIETSATRQYGGTGIGLALVKELAELMGGSVGVQSELGEGARFFVRLPRGADRPATPAAEGATRQGIAPMVADDALRRIRFQEGSLATSPASSAQSTAASRGASMPQVLVVDDNADMRAYITELLQEECGVLTAADGEQAWALLQQHPVDAVVSDVMMPVLDGLGLTARIKASLCHLPVILVTARGGSECSVSGLEAGADDYITKPFSPTELRARVRSALRMSLLQAQLRERSREAGMAMVAIGVLHNLGNMVNGITVSSAVIEDRLHRFPLPKLHKTIELLQEHREDLPGFIERDSRGQTLPAYLAQLNEHLEAEHAALIKEIESLRACAAYVADLVTTQQEFAKTPSGLQELVSACGLIETALKLSLASFDMHELEVERDYACTTAVFVDRHKVLRILLNLLGNASQALRAAPGAAKRVRVRTAGVGDRIRLEVSDNGVGIAAEHLPLLFNQGFTHNKERGHGFGLHSCANWARELGGVLTAHSDGPGRGATFTLDLPASVAVTKDAA